MILKILIIAGIGVVGFLIYVALKSPDMYIERELLIKAAPEKIFPFINNTKLSFEWTTWMADDPNAKISYVGPSEGLGSIANWESKGNMGIGNSEIIESITNQSVKSKLTFIKPMEMSQLTEVSLNATSEGTLVHMSLTSKNPFILRLMCVFGDMDKMMGGAFEKALLNLRGLVESP